MKKRVRGRTFSRTAAPRKALLASVARSLFRDGKITTTQAKAKEVSRLADRLLTKGKKGDVASLRQLTEYVDRPIAVKIVKELAPMYKDRKGGYTRITKLGPRASDGALMAVVQLVEHGTEHAHN